MKVLILSARIISAKSKDLATLMRILAESKAYPYDSDRPGWPADGLHVYEAPLNLEVLEIPDSLVHKTKYKKPEPAPAPPPKKPRPAPAPMPVYDAEVVPEPSTAVTIVRSQPRPAIKVDFRKLHELVDAPAEPEQLELHAPQRRLCLEDRKG